MWPEASGVPAFFVGNLHVTSISTQASDWADGTTLSGPTSKNSNRIAEFVMIDHQYGGRRLDNRPKYYGFEPYRRTRHCG